MKAVQIHHFGGPEELRYEEVNVPTPGPGEVLVKIMATGVNPIDWKIRNGYLKNSPLPLILGWDFSGVIEEVGADVSAFKAGDEVYGRPDPGRNGTYAEYIAVKASEIAIKPASIDHEHAAAIPLAGLTAWQGLFEKGNLQANQKVLITGASGGVGTMAVQLARWKGAFVYATSSGRNIDFLKELGAHEVIDYERQDFEKVLSGMDLVFDTIGGDVQQKAVQVLKNGGRLVSTVGIRDEAILKTKNIQGIAYMAESLPDQLRSMAELVDAGHLKAIVTKTYPLTEAKEAQQASEKGHTRGKIVLTVHQDVG